MSFHIKKISNLIRHCSSAARQFGVGRCIWLAVCRLSFIQKFFQFLLVQYISQDTASEEISKNTDDISHILVSVLIPVHNGVQDGLERLLISLRNQNHKNIEIIAVNTESTDGSVALLEKYGAKVIHNAMKDFRHDRVRNMAAELAKGEYFLFTVCDVCFDDPNWISLGIKTLRHYHGDSYCTPQRCDEKAETYARIQAAHLYNGIAIYGGKSWLTAPAYHLSPDYIKVEAIRVEDTDHLVRRDTFLKIKYHQHTCEDMDFGQRLILSGGKFIFSTLSSILHYHSYGNYRKFFTRTLVDSGVTHELLMPSRRHAHDGIVDLQICAGINIYRAIIQSFQRLENNAITSIVFKGDCEHTDISADAVIQKINLELQNSVYSSSSLVAPEMQSMFVDTLGLQIPENIISEDSNLSSSLCGSFMRGLHANNDILVNRLGYTRLLLQDYRHLVILCFINIFARTLSRSIHYIKDGKSINFETLQKRVWA